MRSIITGLFVIVMFLFSSMSYAKSYGASLCQNNPDYYCKKIKRGESWDKLFQDPIQKEIVMRLNRMNVSLYAGMVIAVPKTPKSLQEISPFSLQINPPGEKVIVVSLNNLAFGAYDERGNLEYWGPISGGRNYCSDVGRGCRTAQGKFAIYQKGGGGCVSSKFPVGRGGAPMPYCMFFHGGFALHGSYNVPGYNDSHGCVRLFIKDAKWLNQEFATDDQNVRVIVQADPI